MDTYAPLSFQLAESDIRLFLREAPRPKDLWKKIAIAGTSLLVFWVGSYIFLNYNALLQISSTPILAAVGPTATPAPQAAAAVVTTPSPAAKPLPSIPSNTLSLPALNNLSAPVHWNTPITGDPLKPLETGVIHILGTALPGQHGFVVISGHSSNYPWAAGSYNTIFAPLQRAVAGEEIVVNYNDSEYRYKITRTYVVQATDLSVLNDGNGDGIRLITCTPIGTSLRRLVVEGVQISPDPSRNAPFIHSHFTGTVPASR